MKLGIGDRDYFAVERHGKLRVKIKSEIIRLNLSKSCCGRIYRQIGIYTLYM